MVETGAIGFAIVVSGSIVFFVTVLKNLFSERSERNWTKGIAVGGLSSVGAGFAHALVEFNFHVPAIAILFVIITALTLIASYACKTSRQEDAIIQRLPQWKARMNTPVRIAGSVFLVLIVSVSAFLILRPCMAYFHYRSGDKLEKDLFWDEAIREYLLATNLAPGNSDYFYALGSIYAKRAGLSEGDIQKVWYDRSAWFYSQAIERCPTNGDSYLVLGNLYELMGGAENAESAYEKTISLDPNNAFYHRTYGDFCLRYAETQKAVDEYKKSIKIYPNDLYKILKKCYSVTTETYEPNSREQAFINIAPSIRPKDVRSYGILAQFCESKGLYDSAIYEYRQAIGVEPDRIELWKRLSGLLMRQYGADEVASLWQEFIRASPKNADAHAYLAVVYVRQKRLDDAIREYLTAGELESDGSGHMLKAGDLYMQQDRPEEALKL